jgi:TRAP-type C4-dicarboxylate transport system substrate-binding protein
MSRRTFDALSASDRELVLAAARDSVAYMRDLWDRMEAESRQLVLAAGVHFNEVDRAAFRKAAAPLLEKYVARGDLEPLYALVRAAA